MRSYYRTVQMEDLWHEEANRNILLSKREKPTTSRKATKSAGSAARKRNAEHGRPSINQTKVDGKRAGEVVGKSEANQAREKVEEKVAENRAAKLHTTIPRSVASSQGNFISWPVAFVRPWLLLFRDRCGCLSEDAQSFSFVMQLCSLS
jgi:transglutaminase/protease-like cytokinesis protein 3